MLVVRMLVVRWKEGSKLVLGAWSYWLWGFSSSGFSPAPYLHLAKLLHRLLLALPRSQSLGLQLIQLRLQLLAGRYRQRSLLAFLIPLHFRIPQLQVVGGERDGRAQGTGGPGSLYMPVTQMPNLLLLRRPGAAILLPLPLSLKPSSLLPLAPASSPLLPPSFSPFQQGSRRVSLYSKLTLPFPCSRLFCGFPVPPVLTFTHGWINGAKGNKKHPETPCLGQWFQLSFQASQLQFLLLQSAAHMAPEGSF